MRPLPPLLALLALLGARAGGGMHVTDGAAAGYVADRECAGCHREIWDTYQQVGMARSFYRPRREEAIEAFGGKPFFHAKSQQYMEMVWRDGRLVFRRWQLGADGTPVNLIEQPVDWIIGSGHHARAYVYQTPGGELYQLPLNWYTQTKSWGMAPGYDRPDHEGITRRVRHECMFCHNAYPEIAEQKNAYWRTESFPAQLPEGIGCQRCHGPGAAHIDAVRSGDANRIHSTIVNPSSLDPKRRNDVCYECHMQPSVALPALRRFDRDIYSFRPGQKLSNYMLHVDITEKKLPRSERFEINHHPYRLEQSRCFRESEGRLSCLSCHDPHHKVPPAERAAHYRKVCTSCHKDAHPTPVDAAADCTSCHMPARRTQDVVNVVMTDHFIRRQPGGPELVAPLEERDPDPIGIDFLDPSDAPEGDAGEVYRAAALIRASGGSNTAAVRKLQDLIARTKPPETEPYFDLVMGLLRQRDYAAVEKILETRLDNAQALEWLGLARFDLGKREEGIAAIERSIRLDPMRPEAQFNLGLLLRRESKEQQAIPHLVRATELRPNLVIAWYHLGEAYMAEKQRDQAIAAYKRALAIDPAHKRASAGLNAAMSAPHQ